ncbi:hypothetical protein G9A89_010812 [Geosiphon pyriformis]|nr:hypothetical protein G9A89_010812 [Geosiphon pyriformis]
MNGRSSRRVRRAINPRLSTASNALYVGYVEDDESIEAIMKKFEELERIQEEIAATKPDDSVEMAIEDIDSAAPQVNEALTEEQLIEVFKRTSSFTVKSATFAPNFDDLQDLEYWRIEMEDGNTAEFEEEEYVDAALYPKFCSSIPIKRANYQKTQFPDYLAVDDDFWEEEFGNKKKRGRKNDKASLERRRRGDRESIIQRYKLMQVEDRNGNFFMVKRKIRQYFQSTLTQVYLHMSEFLRCPSPVPGHIRSDGHFLKTKENLMKDQEDIISMDLTTLGKNYQAVYIDPPLLLPGESAQSGKITIKELGKLDIPKIILRGFLFVWAEKEYLPDILQIAEKWGFRYVENFCWIKKNINNQFARLPYRYFNKSKLSLLVFRKKHQEGEIEIRHQRNADCVFDFIKPHVSGNFFSSNSENGVSYIKFSFKFSPSKPRVVHEVIETMLPGAAYSERNNKADKLLELEQRGCLIICIFLWSIKVGERKEIRDKGGRQ